MISWKEEYSLGIEEIDNQHKRLFEIADMAYGILSDRLSIDKYDRIVGILEELRSYTKFHFGFEEEYMHTIGYRKLLSHKVEHDDFIERIDGVDLKKLDDDQEKYLTGILDFIIKWITGHILGRDRDYAQSTGK